MSSKKSKISLRMEIDLTDFCDEFQSLDEWIKEAVEAEIKRQLRDDPQFKELVAHRRRVLLDAAADLSLDTG